MTAISGIKGRYFPPLSSRSTMATLTASGNVIIVSCDDGERYFNLEIAEQTDAHVLLFKDGGSFTADNPIAKDDLPLTQSRFERRLTWFEQFSWPKLILLCVIFICVIVFFRVGIKGVTYVAADYFPHSWEQEVGKTYYGVLKKASLFPSKMDPNRQDKLRTETEELARNAGLDVVPQVHFHASPSLGANALAFPGGPIVVTDGLLEILDSDDEVLAVIAHELGHVQERHSLRQTIDLLGTALLVSFIFGTDDGLTEEIAALGLNGLAFSNSRDFERDADDAAISILLASDRAPSAFVTAMEKLTEHQCKQFEQADQFKACMEDSSSGWLSTHPTGAERLKNIEDQIEALSQ